MKCSKISVMKNTSYSGRSIKTTKYLNFLIIFKYPVYMVIKLMIHHKQIYVTKFPKITLFDKIFIEDLLHL